MDTRIHGNSVGALIVAAILTFATTGQYAFGDAIVDDITVNPAKVTVSPGDSFTVKYRVVNTGNAACDPADGTAVTVTPTVSISSSGITFSPSSLTFSNCGIDQSTILSVSSTTKADVYDIAVNAVDAGDNYNTADASFKLFVKPPTPVLSSPSNGATIADNTPTLSWTGVDSTKITGGFTYEIEVDNNSNFGSPEATAIGISSGTTSFTVGSTLADNTYNWHVRVRGQSNNVGDYSSAFSFILSSGPPPDTTAPTVTDVSVTDTLIAENNDGDTFTVNVTFSEAMDTSINPTITFDPSSATTLISPTAGAWDDSSHFSISYTVDDANVEQEGVDIQVNGAEDVAGNPQDVYTELYAFNIDTLAPTVTGTPDRLPDVNGWYNAQVTISWSGGDICDTDTLYSGPDSSTASVQGECSDGAANIGTGTFDFMYDGSAPTVGFTLSPSTPDGENGWYVSNIEIEWTFDDPTSGIDGSLTEGCLDQILSSDFAATQFSCDVTNNAGLSSSDSIELKRDATAPSITATATPAANANGWNKDDVVVSFECTDALSDVASCSDDVSLTAETALAGTLVSGTATDNAGNSMSASLTVKIDKTAPTISATAIPAPNANGWNNADVTVEFSCGDALSGVAECPDGVVLTLEGSGQSASGTATDNAGNTASITVENINIDKTNPTITGSRTPLANSYGWNNVDVTVHFECEDLLSDIDSCPADTVLDLEGADQFVTGTAYDKAGNSESDTVSDVNIDKTDPTISATATPAANSNGWNNGAVTVQFTCDDALSGVDACPADVQLTSEGAGQSATGTVYDKAGNSESASATGINIDLTQPTVAITGISDGQSFYFGDPIPAAGCNADDALSGLDGSCSVGSPSPNNANVGSHTLTAQATDKAGNIGETTITYTIKAWTLKGFYQPTDKLPTINTVKNGATVPLKWQVFKDLAMTMEITDIAAIKSVASKEVSCSSAPTDAIEEIVTTGGTVLRYDATAHQFIDNWKTPAKPGKCFDVFMYTQDGSFLNARFQLK